jgi:creatinine amidohydrolase
VTRQRASDADDTRLDRRCWWYGRRVTLIALEELTWKEAEALREQNDAVGLIPTGALEQHGPHLPLGTDFMVAEALARAVAEKLPVPVVVTPALRAGLSDHHLAFPGTVSLSQDSFRGWVDAHIAGLERIGIERVAVFSGHGGNFAFIGELIAEHTSRQGSTRVIAYDDLFGFVRVMDEAARACGLEAPETDVHAGALETSVGLALFAGLVGDYDGVEGYTAAEPGWTERIWADGIAALSSTGVLGDPAGATAEAGQAIFDALADELTGWIAREFDIPVQG